MRVGMGSKLGSACNQVDLVDYGGGTSLGLGQRPGPDFWLVEDKPQALQAPARNLRFYKKKAWA